MQIKEANLFQFGKLQNRSVSFSPGINVIYGKNETGKTTLHTFLKAMLFGMEKGRGRGAADGDYIRYTPWHAPSFYAGALRFEVGGQPFYLERNFYVKERQDYLRNEADGEELSVAYGDLSMLLGKITGETYGSTYDISQNGAASGVKTAEVIAEYLSQTVDGSQGMVPVTEAAAALEKRRKELLQEQRKLEEAKKSRIEQLAVEERLLVQECEKSRMSVQKFAAEQECMRAELAEEKKRLAFSVQREIPAERNTGQVRKTGRLQNRQIREKTANEGGIKRETQWKARQKGIIIVTDTLFGLAGMLFLCLCILNKTVWAGITAGICLMALLLFQFFAKASGTEEKKNSGRRDFSAEETEKESGYTRQEQERTQQKALLSHMEESIRHGKQMLQVLQDTLREKENRLFNVQEEMQVQQAKSEQERRREEDIRALELARKEIERIAGQFGEEFEDTLNSEISRLVSLFTDGIYDSVRLDTDRKLIVLAGGKEVRPESLSRGTLEQIYLALRIASGNLFAKEECLPVMLDEAFVMYDDDRLAGTLETLAKLPNQILIFTCQRREEEILQKKDIPYHRVEL